MKITANRDEEQITALVEDGSVAVLATASADATQTDVLEAIAELDQQLEQGIAVLASTGTTEASQADVHRAVADGGADHEC